MQKTTMKEFEQQAEVIRQENEVLVSECNQNITVINAKANAEAYYIKEVSKATARRDTLNMQSWVYEQAISMLGFTEDDFSEYMLLTSVANQPDATIIVGLEDNKFIINN